MPDLRDVVTAIVDAMPPGNIRLRQAVIVSVQADNTVTLTISGSTIQVSGIKVLESCTPVAGRACWILTDGRDMFVLGHLTPPPA